MSRIFLTLPICGLLMIFGAYAQSGQPIQAQVPFAFVAENTRFAAGPYQLTYSTTSHKMMIRSLDQKSEPAFATTIPATASGPRGETGKLVFRCYEKTCYLAQVWQGSVDSGRGLELRYPAPVPHLAFTTRVVAITIPVK